MITGYTYNVDYAGDRIYISSTAYGDYYQTYLEQYIIIEYQSLFILLISFLELVFLLLILFQGARCLIRSPDTAEIIKI